MANIKHFSGSNPWLRIKSLFMLGLISVALLLQPQIFGQDNSKTKVAVVGLVHDHAWGNLRDLGRRADVQVVGVSEQIAQLREKAKVFLGQDTVFYDDMIKMLDEKRPQAVICFTDTRDHLPLIKACAQRRIHVMMEKPLACTFAEAKEAYELAQKAGIKVMVNYWIAWSPEPETVLEQVKSGAIGRVWKLNTKFGHSGPIEIGVTKIFADWLNDPERNGGGAIMDFGCYGADLMRWIMGKPTSVTAITRTFKPQTYKVDDDSIILLNYPGAVGIIEGSWNWPKGMAGLTVYGDKGSISCEVGTHEIELVVGLDKIEPDLVSKPPEKRNAIACFLHAVQNNVPLENIVSAEFNLDVMEILEAARISAKTGRTVSLGL